jgi:hypothetical protein
LTDSVFSANGAGLDATIDASAATSVEIDAGSESLSDIYLIGSAGADRVTLGAANDVASLGASNDTVNISLGGNDSINLGAGADMVVSGDALNINDTIMGGGGEDVLSYVDADDGLTNELNNIFDFSRINVTNGTGSDTIDITLVGTTLVANATLDASAATGNGYLLLDASAEDDGIVILGTARADQVTLGAGNDVLDASAGADVVNAADGGEDSINLGADNDTVSFGTDVTDLDTVRGGDGTDVLVYSDTTDGSGNELNSVFDI